MKDKKKKEKKVETTNTVAQPISYQNEVVYNYGNSIYGGYIFSHEAIISKIYQGNIVESYFVSYNWAEPPLSYPIQISRTKKPLEYIMDTKDFDFSSLHKDAVNLIHNDCKIIIPKEVKIIPNFGIKKEDNEE